MIPEMETHEPPDLLTPRRFNSDVVPAKPVPIFTLGETVISTVGNITNIQAPPKGGKSAVVAAMIAAVLNANRQGVDTLGFSAENTEGKALIHFDTEQSAYDHDQLVRRALKRAKVGEAPAWLMSYCVTDLSIEERKKALEDALAIAQAEHGGVFAVIIDGIADLCASPNDEAESFALVASIAKLAASQACAVVTVLHENPGSETGKMRGHLGSQLERKAETPLRLAKDSNGVTTIWADRARHGHMPKDQGLCFQWSDSAGMHVSCGNAGEIRSTANRAKMEEEASASFVGTDAMTHGELMAAVGEALVIKERASKLRIQRWSEAGIITKTISGKYSLSV
jgi:hypothetical protein